GGDAEPPCEDDGEGGEEADERAAAPWQQREGEERPGREEHAEEPCGGKVRVPDRERGPGRHPRDGESANSRDCDPCAASHESVPRAHHPGGKRSRIWCTAASTRFAGFSSELGGRMRALAAPTQIISLVRPLRTARLRVRARLV